LLPLGQSKVNAIRLAIAIAFQIRVSSRARNRSSRIFGRPADGRRTRGADVSLRTAVPEHVEATPAFLKLLEDLAVNPGLMARLDSSLSFDPE
jgi:hypothetical protein